MPPSRATRLLAIRRSDSPGAAPSSQRSVTSVMRLETCTEISKAPVLRHIPRESSADIWTIVERSSENISPAILPSAAPSPSKAARRNVKPRPRNGLSLISVDRSWYGKPWLLTSPWMCSRPTCARERVPQRRADPSALHRCHPRDGQGQPPLRREVPEREQGRPLLSCSCPFFLNRSACKHLWARALSIAAR